MKRNELLKLIGFSKEMIEAIDNYERFGIIDNKPFNTTSSCMTVTSLIIDSSKSLTRTVTSIDKNK